LAFQGFTKSQFGLTRGHGSRCLRKIYDLLREQEEGRQFDGTRKERAALRTQGWANLSVVVCHGAFIRHGQGLTLPPQAVFLASLSAGLLALTGSTGLSRDPSTARKLTDDVVDAFGILP